MSLSPAPRDVPSLLAALQGSDPGRPRITWYGPDGERVELSARVLDNWVVKTANLLVEELDAGAGTTVRIDLPLHWRSVVWAMAVSCVGADVSQDAADVVVTTSSAVTGDDVSVVGVALPALARSVSHLPPGALDYNATVGNQPDVLMVAEEPAPLPTSSGRWAPGDRVLVVSSEPSRLQDVVDVLAADGSVVIVDGSRAGDADDLAEQERATARM